MAFKSKLAFGFRKRRVAKKYLSWSPEWYRRMERGSLLQPGDLIHGCNGFNDRIVTIEPVYRRAFRDKFILVDFDVVAENGVHSFRHCCSPDLLTREEILAYFQGWARDGGKAARDWGMYDVAAVALLVQEGRGEELFTPQGTPTEFCVQVRREARDVGLREHLLSSTRLGT